MAELVYSVNASLDGYMEDAAGSIDWTEPSEELHRFINARLRGIGTFLLGRRMYETLRVWESGMDGTEQPDYIREFAGIWKDADKVVYSRTLSEPSTARTRIEGEFSADTVRELKAGAGRDLLVGGPELAAVAIGAGLVDSYELYVVPVVLGAGKRALPDVRIDLALAEKHRFESGTVYLRYRVR
jgi:dihydrofolate reductase